MRSLLRVQLLPVHVHVQGTGLLCADEGQSVGPSTTEHFCSHLFLGSLEAEASTLQAQRAFAVAASYFLGDLICVVEESLTNTYDLGGTHWTMTQRVQVLTHSAKNLLCHA